MNVEVLGILIFANEGVGLRRFPGGGFVESGSKHTDAIVMVPESSNGVLAMLAVLFAGIDAILRDKGKKEKKGGLLVVGMKVCIAADSHFGDRM